MTAEQFARWLFEADKAKGLHPPKMTWEKLPKDERDTYLGEATFYVNSVAQDKWPDEILERLKTDGKIS